MSSSLLEEFGLRYKSTIEEDITLFLIFRSLLDLVAGIPPSLCCEIGPLPPALELVFEL